MRVGLRSLTIGERVRLGGGYYEHGVLPDPAVGAAERGRPGTYFLTSGPSD